MMAVLSNTASLFPVRSGASLSRYMRQAYVQAKGLVSPECTRGAGSALLELMLGEDAPFALFSNSC